MLADLFISFGIFSHREVPQYQMMYESKFDFLLCCCNLLKIVRIFIIKIFVYTPPQKMLIRKREKGHNSQSLLFNIEPYSQQQERHIICIQFRSNLPEVFLGKSVPKICSKRTGENPCRSVISKTLQSSFIEITLRHGCSVNLLYFFRTHFPFPRTTSGGLLLLITRVQYTL